MSIKRNVLAIGAILTFAGGLITVGTTPAKAATPACNSQSVEDPVCISIFSRALGAYGDPNVVEAVLDGVAAVGQPVILAPADRSDTALDFKPVGGTVADFYAIGMLSAEVNSHYGPLPAAQIEYAPNGIPDRPLRGRGRRRIPERRAHARSLRRPGPERVDPRLRRLAGDCARLVPDRERLDDRLLPSVAMTYPQDQYANPARTQQIIVRRLQFVGDEHTLRDTQLWGAHIGVLP